MKRNTITAKVLDYCEHSLTDWFYSGNKLEPFFDNVRQEHADLKMKLWSTADKLNDGEPISKTNWENLRKAREMPITKMSTDLHRKTQEE